MVDGAGALDAGTSGVDSMPKDDATTGRNLLSRKYTRLFEILDVDNSGTVTEADIIELGRRLANAGHGKESPGALELSIALTEIWPVGDRSLADGREKLSRDDVVQTLFGYLERRPDWAINLIGQLANILFATSKQDGDDKVGREEFIQLGTKVFSLSSAEAEEAWTKVDVLERGYVDYPQYLTAMTEFMTSVDWQSPGNWIFGRV